MSTQQQKIYPALIEVMREIDCIEKSEQNRQQGFKFRSIDATLGALHPIMAKQGLVCIPIKVESNTTERTNTKGNVVRSTVSIITYRFLAEDGSYVDSQMAGESCDTGDKSVSKSVSIALKTLLFNAFLIPTESTPDPDAESHQLGTTQDDRYSDEAITKKEKQRLKDQGLDPDLAEPAYPKTANTSKRQAPRRQDGELPDWMTNYEIQFIKSHKGKTLAELNPVQLQAIARAFEKNAEACEKNEEKRRESQMIKRAILFHAEEGDKLEGVENP